MKYMLLDVSLAYNGGFIQIYIYIYKTYRKYNTILFNRIYFLHISNISMLNLQILVMSAVMNENEEIKKKSIYEDVFVILHPFYLQKKNIIM